LGIYTNGCVQKSVDDKGTTRAILVGVGDQPTPEGRLPWN
jgi:hypothetical protein